MFITKSFSLNTGTIGILLIILSSLSYNVTINGTICFFEKVKVEVKNEALSFLHFSAFT